MFVFFQFLINRVLDQGNKREKFLLINFLLFFFFYIYISKETSSSSSFTIKFIKKKKIQLAVV